MTFKEYLKLQEELWMTQGPQDNPSNPGTKRKNAKDLYNHRYGDNSGGNPLNVTPMAPNKMKK